MTKKPLNRVPASPVRSCAAVPPKTAQEMYRLLELRPDGAAYRGTCPSCWYKGAFFARNGTDGAQLFCLEGCAGKQISAAMARAQSGALPPNFARPRPCDAKPLPFTSLPGSDERH